LNPAYAATETTRICAPVPVVPALVIANASLAKCRARGPVAGGSLVEGTHPAGPCHHKE
jgi:hypothetical protein